MIEEQIDRLLVLFESNSDSCGESHPENKDNTITVKAQPKKPIDFKARWHAHLTGGKRLGLVPIMPMGTCKWAAIDVDNHAKGVSGSDLPVQDLSNIVQALGLPLVTCRTRSGGVHFYAFFTDQVPALAAVKLMSMYQAKLVAAVSRRPYSDALVWDAIFPKQVKLPPNSLGSFINVPYGNGTYAVSEGFTLSLDEFLDLAEKNSLTPQMVDNVLYGNTSVMPPCLNTVMRSGGFPAGTRNESTFHLAVYAKKLIEFKGGTATPKELAEELRDLVPRFMSDPLPDREIMTIAKSVAAKEYQYKCKLPIFKEVCDSGTCKRMPCGISPDDSGGDQQYQSLTQYINVDPPVYDLVVNIGTEPKTFKNIPHEVLMDHNSLFKFIAKSRVLIPKLKPADWFDVLAELMANAKLEELPEEATPVGFVKNTLYKFANLTNLESRGDNWLDVCGALDRGMPTVYNGELMAESATGMRAAVRTPPLVVFNASDFSSYLIRQRQSYTNLPTNAVDAWMVLSSNLGARSMIIGAPAGRSSSYRKVWAIPVDTIPSVVNAIEIKPSEF